MIRNVLAGAAAIGALASALVVGGGQGARAQSEDWTITDFGVTYEVTSDGVLSVVEDIAVDFGGEQKHGIFRDLNDRIPCGTPIEGTQQPIHECPEGSDREYDVEVESVTDFDGNAWAYEVGEVSGNGRRATRIKIGDPDIFVTGEQEYRITYSVRGALDAYEDHDELYWDASGQWPVPFNTFRLELAMPLAADVQAVCYEGYQSSARCDSETSGNTAMYASTRIMYPNEEVTIVAGWQKGVVTVAPPMLHDRPSIDDYFAFDFFEYGGLGVVALVGFGTVAYLWWKNGRDQQYKTVYYLTQDPTTETKPLFGDKPVVVEYLPPDDLRPGEMGLILDERADTLDVTATLVDLAVRGYLHITEIPKEGWFGSTDWKLTKLKEPDEELLTYERTLLKGLFRDGDEIEMSELKDRFATRLANVKKQIYTAGMKRKWFYGHPDKSKGVWLGVAVITIVAGVLATVICGLAFGRALIGVPIVFIGVFMLFLSRAMARRTPTGSEALRRVLGFRLYIATAETRMQEFNEQQNIFARYLPFAIVFGCVDKWAKAFAGLEAQAEASTVGWYTGVTPFHAVAFASGMRAFSGSVGATLASTPSSSGSGGSGFSGGGFSGGGGGGGGGGSW